MLRTVVLQNYTGNLAVDTSGYFNHGIPIQVTSQYPGFAFNQPSSRITIQPSPSLTQFGCISVAVTFFLQPFNAPHRYNLAEGFESFALFVNDDLSISCTILDASSNWTGATSAPNTVTTNTSHIAVLECDGINMVRILLDGKVVTENYNVLGEIRDVGSLGLAIGHWPDPPDQYTFEGTIFGVMLQKYDPQTDLTRALDPCCFDRDAIAAWYRSVAKKGVSIAQLMQAAQALKSATKNATVALRGGDKTRTTTQQALASAFNFAMQRRDAAALELVLKQWQASFEQLDDATRTKLANDIQNALAAFGLDWTDWCRFLNVMGLDFCCFDTKGRVNGR